MPARLPCCTGSSSDAPHRRRPHGLAPRRSAPERPRSVICRECRPVKHPRAVGGTRPNDDYPSTLAGARRMVLGLFIYPWVRRINAVIRRGRLTPTLSLNHSPPFFAKRRDRQRGRREPSIVGLLSNAPTRHPRALSIGAFYQSTGPPIQNRSGKVQSITFHRSFSGQ